jgi:hypothetical protein
MTCSKDKNPIICINTRQLQTFTKLSLTFTGEDGKLNLFLCKESLENTSIVQKGREDMLLFRTISRCDNFRNFLPNL